MGVYWYNEYQIFEQDGKYGLKYDGQVMALPRPPFRPKIVLPPIYTSLQVINQDLPLTEHEIQELEEDRDVVNCGESNCPIVVADGKQGLVHLANMITPLKYDQIIKLTYHHYLCQEDEMWILYCLKNYFNEVSPVVSFQWFGELTLEKLLQILDEKNAYWPKTKYDYDALSYSLYKESGKNESGRYLSEYRRYSGWQYFQEISYSHDFIVYTERVVVSNDFKITHYDKKYPGESYGELSISKRRTSETFTRQAIKIWEKIPEVTQTAILSNVWCDHCKGVTTIIKFKGKVEERNLLISGFCKVCDSPVSRLIEFK